MNTVKKEYIERDGQTLKVEVYYSLGGMNYFASTNERRGYYLSVSPVNRTTSGNGIVIESYTAYTGIKELLLEVGRKSKKAEKEAEALASEEKIEKLIQYVLNKAA